MSSAAISIRNLGKRYRVNQMAERAPYRTLRDSLARAATVPLRRLRGETNGISEEFWALKDVEFEVEPGEVVGIIGRNGAGKSTLLKILSRITTPTTGEVTISGRVGSLLEVGTGFHPELTGRENIYMSASILGMSRREIAGHFDTIVDFSGVAPFLDIPIKRYSSGMQVRLAFAVAAHLDPDVLMIDEVLAVGDAEFQKKCLRKMDDLSRAGRTVLFVSHNITAVRRLTTQCAYLQSGSLIDFGPTAAVAERYFNEGSDLSAQRRGPVSLYRRPQASDRIVRFERVWVTGHGDQEVPTLSFCSAITLNLELSCNGPLSGALVNLGLFNERGELVLNILSWDYDFAITARAGSRPTLACTIRRLPLTPGLYTLGIGINQSLTTIAFDCLSGVPLFRISPLPSGQLPTNWPERTWGALHWGDVAWSANNPAGSAARNANDAPSIASLNCSSSR